MVDTAHDVTDNVTATVVLTAAAEADLGPFAPKPTALTDDDQVEALRRVWTSAIAEAEAGVWEATEGSFAATRDGYDEICHIVAGRVTVVADGGDPVELGPGDVLITPCGWRGVWHVHERLRKVYVLIRRP
jgi:uncharacterized cupin superfamily protein